MKITDKTSTEMRFENIRMGDTFKIFADIFMKTDYIHIQDCEHGINAVNFCTGCLHSFSGDEIVIPVDAEVIVTSKTEL